MTFASKVHNKFLALSKSLPANSIIDVTKYEKGLFKSKAKVSMSMLNSLEPISLYGTVDIEHGVLNALNLFNPFTGSSKKETFKAIAHLSPISTEHIKITSNPEVENIRATISVFADKSLKAEVVTPKFNVLQNNSRYEVLQSKAQISHSIDGSAVFSIEGVSPKISFRSKDYNGFVNTFRFKVKQKDVNTMLTTLSAESTSIDGKLIASGKKLQTNLILSNLQDPGYWSLANKTSFKEFSVFKKKYSDSEFNIMLENIPNRLDLLRLYALYSSEGMMPENTPSLEFNLPIRMAVDLTDFVINKHFTNIKNLKKIQGNQQAILEFKEKKSSLAGSYVLGLINSKFCKQNDQLSLSCSIKLQDDGIEINGNTFKHGDPKLSSFNLGKVVSKSMPTFYQAIFNKETSTQKLDAPKNS